MKFPGFLNPPPYLGERDKQNFINVEGDAIGVGLISAAAPFLPVYLTRLGASYVQVALLTSLPAITGFFLSVIIGRYLQTRRNIVPWFTFSRLLSTLAYTLIGLASFIVPQAQLVPVVLAIWAISTIPQTFIAIAFNVTMNTVAGPKGRFELMSRRWSILGFTTSIAVVLIGQLLSRVDAPLNYQIVFLGVSIGGLISLYFSRRIVVADNEPVMPGKVQSSWQRIKDDAGVILKERPFIVITLKQLLFMMGTALAVPLFPLYYVRTVQASDAWIGIFNTAQTAILIIGYFLWIQQSRMGRPRRILLWSTLGLSAYPILVALTHQEWSIAVIAGFSGIFQAGINLIFFDDLMKTVPFKYSAIFVAVAQSLQYVASIAAPLMGTFLADRIGISGALIASGLISLLGFGLFAVRSPKRSRQLSPAKEVD